MILVSMQPSGGMEGSFRLPADKKMGVGCRFGGNSYGAKSWIIVVREKDGRDLGCPGESGEEKQ